MKLKILALGGSSSKKSINKQLAKFVASLFSGAEVTLLDLNDFAMPVFSVDIESTLPDQAFLFAKRIDETDLIVMSLAEHNGSYSTAFKNTYDWVSRIPNRKVFNNKPVLLFSTSPGPRGGSSVLEAALKRFAFDGAVIIGSMSLPSFSQNFSEAEGITHADFLLKTKELVRIAVEATALR